MSCSTTGNLITQLGWFGHGLMGLPWILGHPKETQSDSELEQVLVNHGVQTALDNSLIVKL